MAYNPDAVSSTPPGIRLFYATPSPFLAAAPPSTVVLILIRLMHSANFSVPRLSSVCVDKEPGITGEQNSCPVCGNTRVDLRADSPSDE